VARRGYELFMITRDTRSMRTRTRNDRTTRLVFTQIFEAFPDAEMTITVTLEEQNGKTRLVVHEVYPNEGSSRRRSRSGMEHGMRETRTSSRSSWLRLSEARPVNWVLACRRNVVKPNGSRHPGATRWMSRAQAADFSSRFAGRRA
jgi:hypothetical protein